jgi:hypothetical protein
MTIRSASTITSILAAHNTTQSRNSNYVARLSLQQKIKQLHVVLTDGKQNTWILGNLRTRKIREIAAGGRINIFW